MERLQAATFSQWGFGADFPTRPAGRRRSIVGDGASIGVLPPPPSAGRFSTTTHRGLVQLHPQLFLNPESCASIDATIARLAGFFSRHPQPATKRVFNRAARSQTMTRVSIYSSALVAFVAGTSALFRPSPMTSSPPGLRHGPRPSRCPPPAGLARARAETRKHALQASG